MIETRESPSALLSRSIGSFIITQALYVVAKLEIADRLSGGPLTASELARLSCVHPGALYRILRALASVGIFSETENETFSLNAAADLLRSDLPGSLRPWAIMAGEEWVRRPWSRVMQSVATNTSAFEEVFHMRPFEYMAVHPSAAKIFDEAMTQGTLQSVDPTLNACDFSRFNTIVDVGGGSGLFLKEILHANPRSNGILFELPAAIDRAQLILREQVQSERCRLISGNFFEVLPRADAYVLKWILHNWDDAQAGRILENCRASMADDGRVLMIERIVSGPNAPCDAKLLDLNMLVTHGGRERTESEYGALLERAGLRVMGVRPAGALFVIEAGKWPQ